MKNRDFKVAIGQESPGMMQCGGCGRPILDRFLLNVLDRAWHIQCVQCSDCGVTLTEKCFSRDGKLYCKNDFFRRYGTKCAGCSLGISPSDLVRRARNKVFHLKCFTCMMCRKELSTGEELYILDENRFICKEDYISSKLSGSDIEDEGDFEHVLENQDNLSDRDFSLDSDHMDTKPQLLQNLPNNHNENPLLNNHHPMMTKSDLTNSPGSPGNIKDESLDQLSDSCPSPRSPDSQIMANINPGSNCSSMDTNDNNNNKDGVENAKAGSKRRGPRTTIKAKQLEVLKASFNATPKPTRHIREQLAQETGLNMRVIQVWFQNRRSKERRMKQLSALGARRHFFRGPRRMRALRAGMSPSELEESELMGPGFGYYNDNGQEFFPGYQGYGGDFYPGPVPDGHPMNFLPPSGRGTPPLGMELPLSRVPMGPESQYLPPDMLPPSSSPDSLMHPEDQYGIPQPLPPRSLAGQFTSLPPNHHDVPSDTW